MAVPHHITIDLKQDWDSPYKIPRVTQNDTDIEFIITVKDGGREINVAEQYSTVTMTSQRPDRLAFYVLGKPNAETGKVHFTLGSKEVELMGRVAASVQLYSVDGRQSTAHFAYSVRGDLSTQMVPTEKEETLIEKVLVDGPRIISEAEQAALASIASLDDFNQEKAAALADLAEIKDGNRVIFRQPVATFSALSTTYPNPEHGTTVRVTGESATYRYSDGSWVKTDEYNPTAIDQVTAQLADTVNTVDSKIANTETRLVESISTKASASDLETESARIDNLVANAGDTDGNAELLDIRIGFDGQTYPTAGEAVRSLGAFLTVENEPWEVV